MNWQTTYHAAVLETDPRKIFERITSAREDINAALVAANPAEMEKMQQALKALAVLEVDARNWPKEGRFT
jgi:hypothetical protein